MRLETDNNWLDFEVNPSQESEKKVYYRNRLGLAILTCRKIHPSYCISARHILALSKHLSIVLCGGCHGICVILLVEFDISIISIISFFELYIEVEDSCL